MSLRWQMAWAPQLWALSATGTARKGVGFAKGFVRLINHKINVPLFRYGRRKSWHLVGTICVLTSFPFLFMACLGCAKSETLTLVTNFVNFSPQRWRMGSANLLFCLCCCLPIWWAAQCVIKCEIPWPGWASVQISHLALIPCLTACQNERTGLTAFRSHFPLKGKVLLKLYLFLSIWPQQVWDDSNEQHRRLLHSLDGSWAR